MGMNLMNEVSLNWEGIYQVGKGRNEGGKRVTKEQGEKLQSVLWRQPEVWSEGLGAGKKQFWKGRQEAEELRQSQQRNWDLLQRVMSNWAGEELG